MTSNVKNIIAAIAAAGGAGSFAYFAPSVTAAPAATAGVAGVQTVAITGTPTGGTFTLSWNGYTTAPIAYNATASAVAAALNAAAGITGSQQITGTGGPLPTAVALTFPGRLKQVALTANSAQLTGGTTPAVTITQTTPGTQSIPAALSVPGVGWNDGGWCDPKGLDIKSNISTTDIKGFGSFQILTTIYTEDKRTFDLTFLETNPLTVAVFNGLALGSVSVQQDGSFGVAVGAPQNNHYSGYFATNNANGAGSSFYVPDFSLTNRGDLTLGQGSIINRPVTFTAYPDTLGNTVYENHVVPNLAS